MITDLVDSPLLIYLVFSLFLVVWLSRAVKVVGENERLAWFKLGKFTGYLTPGLHITSSISQFVRLRVGDLGTVSGPEFVKFHGNDVPVDSAKAFSIGDSVRINSFSEDGPVLGRSAEVATRHCPNCGHRF